MAALLQVGPGSIDRWRRSGRIPYIRAGRTFRYDPVLVTRALRPVKEHRKTKCWICGGSAVRRRFKAMDDGRVPTMIAVRQCAICGEIRVSSTNKKHVKPITY